jgi:hypothetical protein
VSRKPRQRTKKGVYRRCRRGFLGMTACPGYYLSKNGVQIRHAKCDGDGWIKVGDQRSGRKPSRGRSRSSGRGRRAGGFAASSGVLWFGLGDWLGTVGYVLAAVVIVVAVAVKVLGAVVRSAA